MISQVFPQKMFLQNICDFMWLITVMSEISDQIGHPQWMKNHSFVSIVTSHLKHHLGAVLKQTCVTDKET